MSPPTIRLATREDASALAQLKLVTFRETFLEDFGVPYPPADLEAFERRAYGVDAVAIELTEPTHRTWVVDADGELLGYAHVGPTKLPHPEAEPHHGELCQLYVRRSAQGMKLGGELLSRALGHLTECFPGPTWLGVWSGNLRAQAVYRSRGFVEVGAYRFPVGSWFDDEIIMRRA